MSGAHRGPQLLLALAAVLAASWGGLRLRPLILERQGAEARTLELASGLSATRAEVEELERQLAREQEAGRAPGTALTGSDLSRLAAEAGLAVDVSALWDPPPANRALAPGSVASLPERLHAQDPGRLIIRWSARGEYASLLRFVDALAGAGHAAVLELSLRTPAGGRGPLHIDMVLTP